jgi:hypothetical protein
MVVLWKPNRVSPTSAQERQRALRRLLSLNLPVDDWEKMEDEIATTLQD